MQKSRGGGPRGGVVVMVDVNEVIVKMKQSGGSGNGWGGMRRSVWMLN